MKLWDRIRAFFGADPFDVDDDWDSDFMDSSRDPHQDIPDPRDCGLDCPDTEPTSPGALDTLPGRLE